jgi:oligopeptide/dipeptide ABC transporter ATP-binding protein
VSAGPLLEVQDLQVWFGRRRPVRAVDGVSFTIGRGESVGLVGESGCGKSSLGRALVRIEPVHGGHILFDGVDIARLQGRALKKFHHRIQMIFQDPFGSLNPRLSIGNAIDEVLRLHRRDTRVQRRERLAELLQAVGLDPAYARRYPHEFSGGQRQRIGIARSLAVDPELVVADEPVSALDVSVQVQILNLMKDLQQRMHLAYLFVAHDLAVVRYICDRLLVMYLGRIVEAGPAEQVYGRPAHPYTEALLSAVPDVKRGLRSRTEKSGRIVLQGDIPSAAAVIPGCPFHPRCHRARPRCRAEVPALRALAPGRLSACHFAEEVAAAAVT